MQHLVVSLTGDNALALRGYLLARSQGKDSRTVYHIDVASSAPSHPGEEA